MVELGIVNKGGIKMVDKQMKLVTEQFDEEDIIEEEQSGALEVVQSSTTPMSLESLMGMAEMLSKSTIVPVNYQNRSENVLIALDLAHRMGVSVMMIMQNLHIISGKPSFSGSFIASLIRTNPNYKKVALNYVGTEGKDDWGAYVSAYDVRTGTDIKGATVTIKIAKMEGWMSRSGSKWLSMPEIMLSYRAYAWFARANCPELLFGLHSDDEVEGLSLIHI